MPRWSESEIKLPPTAPPPEPLPSSQTLASRTEASKNKYDDGIENIFDDAKREYNIVAGRKVKTRMHERKRNKTLRDIAIKGVSTAVREPLTGTNSDFFPISNWRYGQPVALIHGMHYYILPNITDWTVTTPDKDIENAVVTGRSWIKSERPKPQVKITAPTREMSVIRDLRKPNAALVALDPPGEQTAGTIVLKGPQNDEKSTTTEEARPRKKRKDKPMVAKADGNGEKVILNISPNLDDLRSGFPDKTIALLMAVLIQLARDGNMNAGCVVAAFNRLLDDEITCLPTRNELQKFYLHECKLMDLISAVTTEVRLSGKNRLRGESAIGNGTPIESDKIAEISCRDSGGGINPDKDIPAVQQQPASSPQSPDIPHQADSGVKKPWRYRDDQGYTPPPARPAISPILPQQEQQQIDPPLDSATSVINSLQPPISIKAPSQAGNLVATNPSPCKLYTFILTGTEMQKMSSKPIKKLVQRWLLEANERVSVNTENSGIQLQDLRVDGKSPMERIITVTSNLDSIETKERILGALRGWNSIEAVFQETDYPQWVIKGAPLGDPRQIAESVARVAKTRLGPRRPVYLARGANTGILRFSTVAGESPMAAQTVELDGKLLSIDHYDKDHRGKREADKPLPPRSIGLRKRKRKHPTDQPE